MSYLTADHLAPKASDNADCCRNVPGSAQYAHLVQYRRRQPGEILGGASPARTRAAARSTRSLPAVRSRELPRTSLQGPRTSLRDRRRQSRQAPTAGRATREFVEAAVAGAFYQDFRINSHNCTSKSGGTQGFEAKLDLLFDRCVEEATSSEPADVGLAYELLFDLLREIDKFEKDIVFFADEAVSGSST